MIRTKRVHLGSARSDGRRILVDRLWPRGISKEQARIDFWAKDVAPSAELRRWYQHDPAKWDEFRERYFAELDAEPEAVTQLLDQASGAVTFVFGSREEHLNNATALREYLAATSGRRRWVDLAPLHGDAEQAVRKLGRRTRRRVRSAAQRQARPRGLVVLFSGPSGTGKTLAADVLASRLGVALEVHDLGLLSVKSVGETEKNLTRLFDGADRTSGVLLFDEAEALFGKRSRIQRDPDRYANLETNYLLGRMRGASVLTLLLVERPAWLLPELIEGADVVIEFPRPDTS